MEGKRFDQIARTLATSGSRRRVLGGFLLGVLGGLRLRPAAADDSGTAIADASGGDHNHATVAEPGASGNDQDRDRAGDNGDHDNGDDKKGGGGSRASDCLCSSGTCCGQGEGCCNRFDQSGNETPIGSVCCNSDTSCACGDCVPFCDFDVPFVSCECNCRPGARQCTLGGPSKTPHTCCRDDEDCCRVGGTDDPDAVNVCCPEGTCVPGDGCSTS